MTMTELPAVASKVFTACKKCGTDRYQVVVAHTASKSAKLECEVCHTKNTLKLASPKRASAPRKSASATKTASTLARFNEMREKASGSPKPYTMKTSFEAGAALQHPKFGLGFVVSVSGQAMQVLFEDAERALVHNRQ